MAAFGWWRALYERFPSRTNSWLFIWVVGGKRREMGLGAYPAVDLAKARAGVATCRAQLEEGLDPVVERDREDEPTFGKCAR